VVVLLGQGEGGQRGRGEGQQQQEGLGHRGAASDRPGERW
jgi:hypothetical protein